MGNSKPTQINVHGENFKSHFSLFWSSLPTRAPFYEATKLQVKVVTLVKIYSQISDYLVNELSPV